MISLSGRSIQSELPYNKKKMLEDGQSRLAKWSVCLADLFNLNFLITKTKCLMMAKADLQNGQFVWCPDPSTLCPWLELFLLKGDFTKNVYL